MIRLLPTIKGLISLAFLWCFSMPVFANSNDIDEMLRKAEAVKTANKADFSKALAKLKPLFDEFSPAQRNYFLFLTGYELSYQGKLEKAIGIYQHVFVSSQEKSMKYRSALSLLNVFAVMKKWEEGFQYLEYILDTKEYIDDTSIRHLGMVSVTIFYVELEQYQYSLRIIEQLKNDDVVGRNKCLIYGLELKALLNTTPSKLNVKQFDNAIQICIDEKESVVANVIRTNLSQHYVNGKNFKAAIEVLTNSMSDIKASNYKLLIIDTHSILAQAHYGNRDLELAEKHAIKVVESYENVSYIKPVVDSYDVLYLVSLSLQRFEAAANYLKKFVDVEKIRFEEIKAKQLAVEIAKYQAIEKDSQIDLLNKQNKILQLEQEVANEEAETNRWIISLLFVSVSIMLLWLFYVKKAQRRLKYLAEYDGLTRICNRTHFTESASTELKNLSKSNVPASLIMFDLDHFKQINDRYGHVAGDSILQKTAHVCARSIRKPDIFGRVGGEEFAIILPRCNVQQAMKIAEECRQRINSIDTKELGIDFTISASFGVTESGTCGYQLKDLLASADKAMYKAKAAGRDRVVLWQTTQKD
jgi:diguanylate cyclase